MVVGYVLFVVVCLLLAAVLWSLFFAVSSLGCVFFVLCSVCLCYLLFAVSDLSVVVLSVLLCNVLCGGCAFCLRYLLFTRCFVICAICFWFVAFRYVLVVSC